MNRESVRRKVQKAVENMLSCYDYDDCDEYEKTRKATVENVTINFVYDQDILGSYFELYSVKDGKSSLIDTVWIGRYLGTYWEMITKQWIGYMIDDIVSVIFRNNYYNY